MRVPSPPPTTASGSPTPAGSITREAAAKQYLAISAKYYAVADPAFKKCGADRDFLTEGGSSDKTASQRLANLRQCDTAMAKVLRENAALLRSSTWPAEVRGDIEALAKLSDAKAYAFEQTAKAQTEDDWMAVAFPKDDGSADLVRARLGLPTRTP